MQYIVDTYILEYIENENKYYISFKDSVEKNCRIEINREIFDEYLKSNKVYVKIKNETTRHLEQSELTEEELYNKTFNKEKSLEDIVIDNIQKRKLEQAKKELTKTQVRRIDLHYIEEITIRELADKENVRKNQIEKSIKNGIKKLKKIFED